jgi:hypothetical protein
MYPQTLLKYISYNNRRLVSFTKIDIALSLSSYNFYKITCCFNYNYRILTLQT